MNDVARLRHFARFLAGVEDVPHDHDGAIPTLDPAGTTVSETDDLEGGPDGR